MKLSAYRILIPIVLISMASVAAWFVSAQRAKLRSVLSGYFESQPADLGSRIGGRVIRIPVREGAAVRAGDPLVELEAGPAREESAAKQAIAQQAWRQFEEVRNGPRAEEIRRQEAAVAEAAAGLVRLRRGPLPEEIGQARAHVRQVEAAYRKVTAGARAEEIEQARAAERGAAARLAQVERGLTPEEKAEARARLEAAISQETLARKDSERYRTLYLQDAISAQQMDRARAEFLIAQAKRKEQQEALRRAETVPLEEREQARQAYLQAKAALDLVRAGSRREDVEAAAAEVSQARQALNLLLRGAREEDIRAAEARVAEAQAVLDVLRAGSRKEEVARVRAGVETARANARKARADLAERIVRAPESGTIERVLVAVGDLVASGTPIVRIDDPQDIWLRVYVPESRLAAVTTGSEALLQVDGVEKPLTAYVESIASRGEFTPANLQTPDERGKQAFGVRLRLRQPNPRVKAGMYATIRRIGQWEP